MSDSNITKRALAQSLKELMEVQPIEKISVGSICSQCGLNRKSFYYHFKDKYELINWIYYTEFVEKAIEKQFDTSWNLFEEMCSYFYENRDFYNKTFRVEGQNSFSEYFFSLIFSIMSAHLADIFKDEPSVDPYAEFYTDALVCAIKKMGFPKRTPCSLMNSAVLSGLPSCGLPVKSLKIRNLRYSTYGTIIFFPGRQP